MINELDKSILKKIASADRPISGADISRMCHISINTLRKEINIINDFLEPHGCFIDTKISIGYSLVITDNSKADPFLYQFLKDFDRYGYLNIADLKKENYIIRRLLSSNSMISIETLINELYCSKSTILRNIERIKNYLAKFHLEIKVKRNEGFYIEGKEWNKRMCLIHQHKIYHHSNSIDLAEETNFNAMFLNNTDYPHTARNIFLSLVPNYPSLSYSHIDLATIFNFIILCKTRHDKSDELVFNKHQLKVARSTSAYLLSKDIIAALPPYLQEDFGENELDALAVLLTGLRKYNLVNYLDQHDMDNLHEEVTQILTFISKKFMIDDIIVETLIRDLCYFLKEQKNYLLFEIYKDDENFTYLNRLGAFSSDLCAYFAYYIDLQKGYKISLDSISRIYSIFNRALFNRSLFYQQNVLVISRYSTYFANNIATRLKGEFHNEINHIEVCEYTDIPNIGLDKFDVIVTDINKSLLSIGIPIVEIEFNRNPRDFERVKAYFNQTIYGTFVHDIFKKEYYIIKNFENKLDVLNTCYDSLEITNISREEWINDCLKREYYVPFEREKEIILVTNLDVEFNEPKFRLLVSSQPIFWNQQIAHIFIYYNYGLGHKKDLQQLAYIIKNFLHQSEQYLSSLHEYSYEEIITKFYENS